MKTTIGIRKILAFASLGALSGFSLESCEVPGELVNFMTYRDLYTQELKNLELRILKATDSQPDAITQHPAILIIHGGGWVSGNFLEYEIKETMKTAAARGYVAVTTSYRLALKSEPNYWPAAIQDVKCAIRWMRANANEYGIDPNQIAVLGISSGGHLAHLAATTQVNDAPPLFPEWESPDCPYTTTSEVNAVISDSGIGDMEALWNNNALYRPDLSRMLNTPYENEDFEHLSPTLKTLLEGISPKSFVNSIQTPVLQIHPKKDWAVHFESSEGYHQALVNSGKTAYLIDINNGLEYFDHFYTGAMRVYSDEIMLTWLDKLFLGKMGDLPCGDEITLDACTVALPQQ